jgi:hypothetical protein
MDDDLDPTVAERILGEYPELLDQWCEQVAEFAQKPNDYSLWMAHQPEYLDLVVQQYRWLTEGPGDSPDPKLERRCREIAARHPVVQKEREESLADPWWRAAVIAGGSKMITEFYDPEFLEGVVKWRREVADNPFSEKNLHLDRLITALEHGGTITLTEIKSGRVVDQWEAPGDPKRASRGEN